MASRDIAELQDALGHQFARPELLQRALTHTSHANEKEGAPPAVPKEFQDNEQLEFLGDAVLGLVLAEQLFRRLPWFREGKLSRLRAHLVSEKHLARVAQELDLGSYLYLGRGEEKSGGRSKAALLADGLEEVLAAVYLDGGLEAAHRGTQKVVASEIEQLASSGDSRPVLDHKSALQEHLQAGGLHQPAYRLAGARGPEHRKTFTVEVLIHGSTGRRKALFIGKAEGTTKKSAEQEAARQALEYLTSHGEDPPHRSPRRES